MVKKRKSFKQKSRRRRGPRKSSGRIGKRSKSSKKKRGRKSSAGKGGNLVISAAVKESGAIVVDSGTKGANGELEALPSQTEDLVVDVDGSQDIFVESNSQEPPKNEGRRTTGTKFPNFPGKVPGKTNGKQSGPAATRGKRGASPAAFLKSTGANVGGGEGQMDVGSDDAKPELKDGKVAGLQPQVLSPSREEQAKGKKAGEASPELASSNANYVAFKRGERTGTAAPLVGQVSIGVLFGATAGAFDGRYEFVFPCFGALMGGSLAAMQVAEFNGAVSFPWNRCCCPGSCHSRLLEEREEIAAHDDRFPQDVVQRYRRTGVLFMRRNYRILLSFAMGYVFARNVR